MAGLRTQRASACGVLILATTLSLYAGTARIEGLPPGTLLVEDDGAPGGRCVAVRIQEKPGAAALGLRWAGAAPGLYRVTLPLRLLARPGFNSALLRMNVAFSGANGVWLTYPLAPAQLDGTPGMWTLLARPVLLHAASPKNRLTVSWSFLAPQLGKKGETAFEVKAPEVAGLQPTGEGLAQEAVTPDMIEEVAADTPMPLAQVTYPAILVGDPTIEPISTTLAIEKVWPEKVHVYPGEKNPIEVTVRNFTDREAETVVRLEMKTGLDDSAPVGEERVRVPARGSAAARFAWTAGAREYGHAAVATLTVDGKPVHSAAEYFTVSTPIWKTAIQGNGFITWYGREHQFAQHVEDNRRAYVNVEEAFSWQPSSWTDLNPTTETWWSGQNGFHNSLSGLREWIGRSHSHGIKMITYSWPSASGKAGFDFGRRFPDILCRDEGGLAQIDLEDLALYDITHSRPELWDYRSGIWLSNGINLGLLRAIDHHAKEVIRSARNFGWDGVRFDCPPGWSAMATADVHKEFDLLGVKDLMKELMPEYYDSKDPVWPGEAISKRNVRYFRHVFKTELGEHFALSYNAGGLEPVDIDNAWWLREMCKGGGQIMNEAIRTVGSIPTYMDVAWWHSEAVRQAGGYSCLFMAEKSTSPLAAAYSAVFTFASGSHPYLDYGWLGPMPGEYTRFMTRYGEYCWDPAFAPVSPQKAGVAVESKSPLLWERYVRQRQAGGLTETVVHLIATPEPAPDKAARQSQLGWARAVTVRKICRSEPVVWLLTAEPEMTAARLQTARREDSYSVTVPSVHFWSILVWSEKP